MNSLAAPICFVHIPKTAGGTLRKILARAFPEKRVANTGNIGSGEERTRMKVARLHRMTGVAAGHTPYALLRAHLPRETIYITMMRQPVDRVISHYYQHLHGNPTRDGVKLESLAHALELSLPLICNFATRLLCSHKRTTLSRGDLEDAKQNIRGFAMVGLQERFDESVVLLRRALGIEELVPLDERIHVGDGGRPKASAIAGDLLSSIMERNALDAELYAYAANLFEEAVLVGRIG
jgi:hypothetical protein